MGTYLQVKIETQAPVILTANRSNLLTVTEREISGGVLRGILVKKWLEQPEHAAESPAFEDFFFGALRFLPARPAVDGMRTYFLPRSLQQSKDKTEYADLLSGIDPDPAHKKGFKSKKGLGVVLPVEGADGTPSIAEPSVRHHIRMHIARGGRDDQDGKNRLAGRSMDGGIFNYESLDAGQVFLGEIHGPDKLLDALRESLPSSFPCRIGRSHQTQYGRCRVTVTRTASTRPAIDGATSICLRLETPLVTDGMTIDAARALQAYVVQPLEAKLPDQSFTISDIHGAQQALSGFNSSWGMKRPDALALAEGTVFRLQKADGSAFTAEELDAIEALAHAGLGIRVEEGFGQLRLWQPGKFQKQTKKEASSAWTPDQAEAALAGRKLAPETRRIATKILARRLQEQARLQAWNDADSLKKYTTGLSKMTHFFARLENFLGTRQHPADVPLTFQSAVAQACTSGEGEEKKQRPFAKRLQELKFSCKDGRILTMKQAILREAEEPLYALPDFLPETKAEEKDMLADFAARVLPPGWEHDSDLVGSTYYDYWLSFLRHARKLASAAEQSQEGGEEDG